MKDKHKIFEKFFDPTLIPTTNLEKFRSCPQWLGNFNFNVVDLSKINSLPIDIVNLIADLCELAPEQIFNTIFIQKYTNGQFVKKHRDPKNNIGVTLIAILGDFDGAITTLYYPNNEIVNFRLNPGDVLKLDCTINHIQGIPHEVSEVTNGTRYAIILNTIVKSNDNNDSEFLIER